MIDVHDVSQVADQIWSGMLQISLQAIPGDGQVQAGIGACVQITGAWEGAVRVDCSIALARLATAHFLGVGTQDVSMDQVRDAMGELANMSAGGLKPLLPPPCQLSLPTVADGSDYNFTIPHGEVVLTSAFAYEGEPMKITIVQRRRT